MHYPSHNRKVVGGQVHNEFPEKTPLSRLFMNTLINAINNRISTTLTENGALTLDKSGSKVLDFFSLGGALRSRTDADVLKIFVAAVDEDSLLALKVLFYLRDVRGGQGERKVFRTCLKWLAENRIDTFASNFNNIAKYGRWDDLFVAFDTPSEAFMIKNVAHQLAFDARASADEKITLLAKWMPSINTSSQVTRALAKRFIKALGITDRKYRKTLSGLRSRLNLVESLMSDNDWTGINYSQVPSKANLNYKKAFSKHDSERYMQFIADVKTGKVKMNAGTLYPYEVIRDISEKYNHDEAAKESLDAIWNSLPDYLKTNPHNGLVLPDVSGSMQGLPIQVSVSLAIYFAQRSKGFFQNHFLEFSSEAVLRRIVNKNIVDVWNEVSNSTTWCGSTDLQSAFNAILVAATENSVPQDEMPDVLYIISDMQFNEACEDNQSTNFELVKEKYRISGYKMPVICFWNVSARNDQSPVSRNEQGVIMVSGCSPSIFSQVISGVTVTPYDHMLEVLNKERYSSVVV